MQSACGLRGLVEACGKTVPLVSRARSSPTHKGARHRTGRRGREGQASASRGHYLPDCPFPHTSMTQPSKPVSLWAPGQGARAALRGPPASSLVTSCCVPCWGMCLCVCPGGIWMKTQVCGEAVQEDGPVCEVGRWCGGGRACGSAPAEPLHFQVSQSSLPMLSSPSPGQQVQTPQSMPPPPQPSPQPGQPGSQPNSNVR